jgi:hypothetical protein
MSGNIERAYLFQALVNAVICGTDTASFPWTL